jgi:hypothetical protein
MELEFSGQRFEKYSNTKFHENPSSGSRVAPCGQTDRHEAANSRFSQFCDRAYKLAVSANLWVYDHVKWSIIKNIDGPASGSP